MGGDWEIQVNVKDGSGEGSAAFKTAVKE